MTDYTHIKYLIQPLHRGWFRVVSTSGVYLAAFRSQADAIAWCESCGC